LTKRRFISGTGRSYIVVVVVVVVAAAAFGFVGVIGLLLLFVGTARQRPLKDRHGP
jgi:hypothetical protein